MTAAPADLSDDVFARVLGTARGTDGHGADSRIRECLRFIFQNANGYTIRERVGDDYADLSPVVSTCRYTGFRHYSARQGHGTRWEVKGTLFIEPETGQWVPALATQMTNWTSYTFGARHWRLGPALDEAQALLDRGTTPHPMKAEWGDKPLEPSRLDSADAATLTVDRVVEAARYQLAVTLNLSLRCEAAGFGRRPDLGDED